MYINHQGYGTQKNVNIFYLLLLMSYTCFTFLHHGLWALSRNIMTAPTVFRHKARVQVHNSSKMKKMFLGPDTFALDRGTNWSRDYGNKNYSDQSQNWSRFWSMLCDFSE